MDRDIKFYFEDSYTEGKYFVIRVDSHHMIIKEKSLLRWIARYSHYKNYKISVNSIHSIDLDLIIKYTPINNRTEAKNCINSEKKRYLEIPMG